MISREKQALGKVNDLWNEDSYGNAIVQFFKIKDK